MSHLNVNGVDKPLDHIRLNNVRSANLFDKSTAVIGERVLANSVLAEEKAAHSDYIDVAGISTLTVNNKYSATNFYFYTDKTKTSIGYVNDFTANVPAGAKYCRINVLKDDVDTTMLNTGTTAKPYEPYLITKEAWEAKSRVILHGLTNPLCGIGTYKDTLDLSTGTLTRYVKKLVLTGEEVFTDQDVDGVTLFRLAMNYTADKMFGAGRDTMLCSHYTIATSRSDCAASDESMSTYNTSNDNRLMFHDSSCASSSEFQSYLAAQYAAGHPVTVWYVLATPEAEQITLPSNLTGIVEGYLTQDSTPSPTSPVYPTANGTLEQGGTYSLDTGAYAIAWGRADTFTGTNSISARCYGLPVKSWEIDGNSQQSGVPSPDNIIMPTFCGVRTGNLVEKRIDSCNISSSGVLSSNASWNIFVAKIEQGKTYSIDEPSYAAFYELNPIIGSSSYDGQRYTIESSFTSPIDGYVAYRKTASELTAMCNEGSTALPYEPFGYKLPITSANQTVPVYLGEVPTVRRVKKLVLTGEEDWISALISGAVETARFYTRIDKSGISRVSLLSSHFQVLEGNEDSAHIRLGTDEQSAFAVLYVFAPVAIATTVDALKSWLAAQYSNGTPVTVWYVLATPETAIVNEPLCKIGEYADELHSADAGITIPTTDGNNTISVDTSLAPSKFEIKVHAKPM